MHGSPEATNHLRDFSLSSLGLAKEKLFTPSVGECIDASTESHIYQVTLSLPPPSLPSLSHQVKLTDSLMSAVEFSKARDSELAWVDGTIHFSSVAPSGFQDQDDAGETVQKTPVLNALPHHQVNTRSTTL